MFLSWLSPMISPPTAPFAVFLWLLAVIASWSSLSILLSKRRTRGLALPPGPPRLPLIGSLLDMPKTRPWIGLRDLSMRHGSVMLLQLLNQPMLVLNDPDAAIEYLEKHSVYNSDRKQVPSLSLTGHDWIFAFLPYGEIWKFYRRLFWQYFHPNVVADYRQVQYDITQKFLTNLLRTPERLKEHTMYVISAAMMKFAYGLDATGEKDEIIAAIDEGLESTRKLVVSGGFLVDLAPVLRYYPRWLPGGGFMRRFAEWKEKVLSLRDTPFQRYKDNIERGGIGTCIVSDLLSALDQKSESPSGESKEDVARNLAAVAFEAGSEATASVMQTFFLAMSLYPDVQRKAQAEILAVVGPDRLPLITDRTALIYVNAIIKECLRWMPVTPLGIAHSTSEDHEFRGYFIPRDTVVMANVWACMHNKEDYEPPDVFQPERFIGQDGTIDSSVRSPEDFVFGFGRRICPGRFYALEALFVVFASVLHVFDISPPRDENGHEIKIEPTMADCLVSRPEDCRCTIKSRGPWADALITDADLLEN